MNGDVLLTVEGLSKRFGHGKHAYQALEDVNFEVRQGGQPGNPLGVRLVSAPVVDTHLADAVKVRLAALLKVGTHS